MPNLFTLAINERMDVPTLVKNLKVFERDLNKFFTTQRGTCLGHFSKASIPSAVENKNNTVVVTDDVTGVILAYSDGAQWLRSTDGQPIE
jgi:hypothetical protein